MKNIWIKISRPILGLLVIITLTQCKEEEEYLDNGAILLLQVVDEWMWEPIAGAEVTVYRNEDDWAFERNPIKKVQTDAKGEVLLEQLRTGEYYFNVVKGSMNNWHYPGSMYMTEGEADFFSIPILENLNGKIASVEGKRWAITGVTNAQGDDISNDPAYACLLDQVVTFMKSGYYGIEEGSSACDPLGFGLPEGSWWSNGYDYLGILIADGGDLFDFYINDLTDNSFSATQAIESNPVTVHYELIQ